MLFFQTINEYKNTIEELNKNELSKSQNRMLKSLWFYVNQRKKKKTFENKIIIIERNLKEFFEIFELFSMNVQKYN